MFKNLVIIVFLLFVFSIHTYAQKIHMIIVTQNDKTIGSVTNKNSMKNFSNTLLTYTGVPVITKFMDGGSADLSKIKSTIRNFNLTSNDVIWFYYSGHGKNNDTWPQTAQKKIPMTTIYDYLETTSARLKITIFDCGVNGRPTTPRSIVNPRSLILKFLFLESKGSIKVASASSGQYAYGKNGFGSVFTNVFLDAVMQHKKWKDVLDSTKTASIVSTQLKKRQVPNYQFSSNFQEPNYLMEHGCLNSIDVIEGYTLKQMAKEIELEIEFSLEQSDLDGKKTNVTITLADLKRWNPGLTEDNLHTDYTELKWEHDFQKEHTDKN